MLIYNSYSNIIVIKAIYKGYNVYNVSQQWNISYSEAAELCLNFDEAQTHPDKKKSFWYTLCNIFNSYYNKIKNITTFV